MPAVALAFIGFACAQTADMYLPWEGGAEYYRNWTNGPPADPSFFPISVWLQNPRLAAQYKAIGINQFLGLWRGPTEDQLKTLAEAGMPALAAQNEIGLASSNAAVLRGWLQMDEPDNAQPLPEGGYGSCVLPPEIIARYEKFKEADATRPIFLNLGQGVINEKWVGRGSACSRRYDHYPEYIKGADIVSYDVYPLNGNLPLWYVGAGVARLREWAEYKKPVWNFIETTSIRGNVPKPTPEQIRSEVWMSIIHGSMGIGYFCHQFQPTSDEAAPLHDAETRETLASINRQITRLAPVLNTPSVANGVTVESSNEELPVAVMLKRHGGATYLFAIGTRPAGETTATFRFRDCGSLTAKVLGESRTLEVDDGVLRDSFADYQVHIYKLPFDPSAEVP